MSLFAKIQNSRPVAIDKRLTDAIAAAGGSVPFTFVWKYNDVQYRITLRQDGRFESAGTVADSPSKLMSLLVPYTSTGKPTSFNGVEQLLNTLRPKGEKNERPKFSVEDAVSRCVKILARCEDPDAAVAAILSMAGVLPVEEEGEEMEA